MTLTGEHHPGILVVYRDGDVRERFVVAQPDVERGSMPLDEVLLEMKRLDLAAGDDHLDIGHARRQELDRGPAVGRLLEVRANAGAERLRLAHVQHLARVVAEQVDARLRRERLELILDAARRHASTVAEGFLRAIRPVVAVAAVSLVAAPGALANGPELKIGATEDAVRSPLLAISKGQMDLVVLAGFDAVRITQTWSPGERAVSVADATILRNVTTAATLDGVEVIASVLPFGSATTPLTDADQSDFATYAASVVRTAPGIRIVIVGNEPNLNRYWLPQFNDDGSDAAAPAYEALLARTYDVLKEADPGVTVLGGAVSPRGGDVPGLRPTHSPTVFIEDMGTAYRASSRAAPIMDGFAFHPYEDNSSIAPISGTHPNTTTIAIADYDKLVALLGEAFDGTAQAGSTLPIYYDEFGVETQIPPAKQHLYTGTEPATTKPVDDATQAEYYRQAIALAFCQQNVRDIFLFHAFDEPALAGWQSGVYYADDTPKTSLAAVRAAMGASRRGVAARCPGMRLAVRAKAVRRGSRVSLSCDLDCSYVAQLYRLPGHLLTSRRGRATGGTATTLPVVVPAKRAVYRVRVSVVAALNPGASSTLLVTVRRG